MLRFKIFNNNGQPAESWEVRNAHLIGSDGSAMRGEIEFSEGEVKVQKRELGAVSLCIQQNLGEFGELTLQTTLLPDRDEAYLLSLEQARHRLMLLYVKLEDWGMLDLSEVEVLAKRLHLCKQIFVEALFHQITNPIKADDLARQCLVAAIDMSEEFAMYHAEGLLNRRKEARVLPKYAMGCRAAMTSEDTALNTLIQSTFDFMYVPTLWKEMVAVEGEYQWDLVDKWINWANDHRMPVVAGPLVSFQATVLPEWVYIWEHDYDAMRDVVYEHIERVVTRYRQQVRVWNAISGIHLNNQFDFSFDQLMDLSRMATTLVKKLDPSAKSFVEVLQPFGEYYAENQKSIPPLMYADLLVQGGIQFDGIIVKLLMGQPLPGQFTRDLMQISHLLDQFAIFGKPVHVQMAVPSTPIESWMIAVPEGSPPADTSSGIWRKPWSQMVQSKWLTASLRIAMSKPFVETVSWHQLVDDDGNELPVSGLIDEHLKPKRGFDSLVEFRKTLLADDKPFDMFTNALMQATAT